MFLKHYTGLSDKELVDRFSTDWGMQLFFGVLLAENESIKDNSFVSRIRSCLAKHVSLEQMHQKMLEKWKPNLENSHVMLADATAYESYIRYPTDPGRAGSFGKEKNHYLLRKIKARSKGAEMIWLFFGVFTANAVKMAKKAIKETSPPVKQAA